MRLATTNHCRACGEVRETMEHILCECDVLATKRMSILGNAYRKPEELRFLPLSGISALIIATFEEGGYYEAQALCFVAVVVAASAAATESSSEEHRKPMAGVDPNTISCDPLGEIFLLLPHYSDCAKFYMCAHGEEVEFDCAPGTIFDFEEQVCNWDWATKCWLREVDEEGSGFSAGELGLFGEEAENGPLAHLTGESSASVRPLSPVAARLFNGILNCNKADAAARQIPYKGDCQRFWKCVDGIPQAIYCSDGLFFNERTQQCDYEANAKCTVVVEDELQGEFMVTK